MGRGNVCILRIDQSSTASESATSPEHPQQVAWTLSTWRLVKSRVSSDLSMLALVLVIALQSDDANDDRGVDDA